LSERTIQECGHTRHETALRDPAGRETPQRRLRRYRFRLRQDPCSAENGGAVELPVALCQLCGWRKEVSPMKHFIVGVLLSLGLVGCGNSSVGPAPVGDTGVGGAWSGTNTLTSVSGFDCINRPSVMNYDFTIRQNPRNLSSVCGVAQSTGSTVGGGNSYVGTVNGASVSLRGPDTANPDSVRDGSWASCANGLKPDVVFLSGSINASVNGDTATGTITETYRFYKTETNTVVGTATVTSRFATTRLLALPPFELCGSTP
jgi:hypothetical protein